MRAVLTALVIGVVAEVAIYRSALSDYSEALCTAMFIAAALGAVILGRFAPRPLLALCGSTALAAPGIAYSMIGRGFLEMGGIMHAIAFGGVGAASYAVFHGRVPWRDPAALQRSPKPESRP